MSTATLWMAFCVRMSILRPRIISSSTKIIWPPSVRGGEDERSVDDEHMPGAAEARSPLQSVSQDVVYIPMPSPMYVNVWDKYP